MRPMTCSSWVLKEITLAFGGIDTRDRCAPVLHFMHHISRKPTAFIFSYPTYWKPINPAPHSGHVISMVRRPKFFTRQSRLPFAPLLRCLMRHTIQPKPVPADQLQMLNWLPQPYLCNIRLSLRQMPSFPRNLCLLQTVYACRLCPQRLSLLFARHQ